MLGPLVLVLCVALAMFAPKENAGEQTKKNKATKKGRKRKRNHYYAVNRKSSSGQDSLTEQDDWGRNVVQNFFHDDEPKRIGSISKTCNGYIFVKKYGKKILKAAEQGIDYLVMHRIDRLSRNPVDGIRLLDKLNNINPLKIISSEGIFDYNDEHGKFWVRFHLLQAEQEQTQKNSRVSLKIEHMYKSSICPTKRTPFGYHRNKDKKLLKNSWCEEIANFIFDTCISVKNYSKTAKITNQKYSDITKKNLNGQDIKHILTDRIYLGYFQWSGKLIGAGKENAPHQHLKVIDLEKFNEAQKIVEEINDIYSRPEENGFETIVDKYGFVGVDYVMKLRPPCPNCGSYDLQENGSKRFHNMFQKKYKCKNKKCRTQFRSPLIRQIKKIHKLSSERCPKCGKTNCYTFSNNGTIRELTCESCGHVRFFTPFTATNNTEKKTESKDKKPSPKKDGNNGRLDSYMS